MPLPREPIAAMSVFHEIEAMIGVAHLAALEEERPGRVRFENPRQGCLQRICILRLADGNREVVTMDDDAIR